MAKTTVFLVDDHEVVRKGLAAVISAEDDFEVVGEAECAGSALNTIAKVKPDAVLLDIAMDGMSPFEMTRACLTTLPKTKIIFLSAFSTDSNIDRAWQSGAHGFVSKRDAVTSVCDAIRTVVGGQIGFASKEVSERLGGNAVVKEFGQPTSDRPTPTLKCSKLSPREHEVLRCVALGQSAKQIAEGLAISAKTVERHKSNIMTKLTLHTQVELTRYAIREGFIAP